MAGWLSNSGVWWRTSLWQWVSGTAGRGRGRLAQHPYVKPADYGPRPGESCDCFIEHSRRKRSRSPYCELTDFPSIKIKNQLIKNPVIY